MFGANIVRSEGLHKGLTVSEKLERLSIGVEEELFLVEKESGALCKAWPEALWASCQKDYPGQIMHEFLNAQAELISKPHNTIAALEKDLKSLRHYLATKANQYGLALMACSTHPRANWHEQTHTASERYQRLADDLQISAERMLVCGMHVHIGLDDMPSRLKLLNELTYFLPVILALSTSSPFWAGEDSGLMSYRATVVNGLPRAGLPPVFCDIASYERYINHMTKSNTIESAKDLWWDMRISARFPTVEIRVADTCTSHKDVMAVASFMKCLSAYLLDEPESSHELLDIKRLCAKENRWRAQRYPIKEGYLLEAHHERLESLSKIIQFLVETLLPFSREFDCEKHLEQCLTIVNNGTSADRQRRTYNLHLSQGLSRRKAMDGLLQSLMAETVNLS